MNFILDEEIGLTEDNDILETKRYAESLKDTILNAPTPFNIGLYGEWGSGKSSIIKTAQTQLEINQDQKIKFVIYDAWKYANDSFRRMFLKTLQEQLKFDGTELFESFYRNKTEDTEINPTLNLKSLGITVTLLILTFTMISSLQLETKWELTLQSIVAFGSMIIAFYKNIFTDYKVTIQKPIMFAPEQFEDAFKDMMSKSLKKYNIFSLATEYVKGNHYEKNIDKLVIVIDNIDRCDKKTAYELLTNIKNFIGKKEGIIFLVPVDDEALKRHMQEHNKENSKEADEFLRKFFNTTIKIKHFQPRDLFEFANKLNFKNKLGFTPDTINIVAKEYASNPRRIIQLFNNLTSELKTIEAKYEKKFIEEHQSLIAKLLIVREEWADVFKEITKYPHLFNNFIGIKIVRDEKEINLDNFRKFMEMTKAITSNVKTVEKIILNITNESTLSNNIIEFIESNNFEDLKQEFEKDSTLFDKVVIFAIEEVRKGLNRKTYSTDAINGVKLLSKLNDYKGLEKAPLSELFGFFDKDDETLKVIEYLQKDDLDSFFKFVEQNRIYGLKYLQNKLTNKFKLIWQEHSKDSIVSLYEDGVDKFINFSTDEDAIKDLQKIFVNYYEYFSNSPLYKTKWINENKLFLIVSSELITHIINKIVPPIIDIKSDAYLELQYFANRKIIDTKDLEKIIEKIKPNFSQPIQTQTDANVEKQKQLDNLFINIQAITNLLKNVERVKHKSEIIANYIQEFLKNVEIRRNTNYNNVHFNLLNEISSNTEYQEQLLNFYLEIYRITYNNTDVTQYIQTLVNQYPQLKNVFYEKLLELRDTYQMSLIHLIDYLLLQKDEDENLFNLYEKLFNRDDISSEQTQKIKTKLDGYIVQLISNKNEKVKNFIDKLMLQSKTKELLTDIIISKDTHDIVKLPQNIKKVAYTNLCLADKIFAIENNIEAIKDIVKSSDEFNDCILKIIKSKLLKSSEVDDALSIINEMQKMSDKIKKEILVELKKHNNHETLSKEVKAMIEKLAPQNSGKLYRNQ